MQTCVFTRGGHWLVVFQNVSCFLLGIAQQSNNSQCPLQQDWLLIEFWPTECKQRDSVSLPGLAHQTVPCTSLHFLSSHAYWLHMWDPMEVSKALGDIEILIRRNRAPESFCDVPTNTRLLSARNNLFWFCHLGILCCSS